METIGGGGADGGQKGLQIRKGEGGGEDLLNSEGSLASLFKGTSSDCIFVEL